MLKKKRLFLLFCMLLAFMTAYYYGVAIAAACVVGVVALLSVLKSWRLITAHHGVHRLKALQPKYAFASMISKLSTIENDKSAWSFIVLGDTRNNTAVAGQMYRRAKEEAPDMVFHTGDIVRGGTARELLNNHVRIIEDEGLTTPVFCVPGNHERGPRRDFAAFKALYGAEHFSFIYRGCLFAGVNNSARRGMGNGELAFLEGALAPDTTHKFVFIHVPPAFFEATFVKDTRRRGFKKNADRFHNLMREQQVDEVFMAHIHGYAATVIDGVRYTLTAGAGAPLSPRIVPENRCRHMLQLTVNAGGLERRRLILDRGEWTVRNINAHCAEDVQPDHAQDE